MKKVTKSNGSDKSTLHILVVDDEPLIQELLLNCLEFSNCNVSLANNGLEALGIMAEKDFDMVFMDIRMPVMDGLTATRFLRQCEQGYHLSPTEHPQLAQSLHAKLKETRTPVVAVTANIADKETVLQAGMDEYIPKPFTFSTIYDVIDQLCGKFAQPFSEKRKAPRFTVKNDSIVLKNGTTGQIIDISSSGLAIKYANPKSLPTEWSASCCNETIKIATPYLPLKLVRKEDPVPSPLFDVETQTVGAIFHNPDRTQQNHIDQFIGHLS